MVGYFFWVIFTNKISKNSHYYCTGGKLLIHTFSLNSIECVTLVWYHLHSGRGATLTSPCHCGARILILFFPAVKITPHHNTNCCTTPWCVSIHNLRTIAPHYGELLALLVYIDTKDQIADVGMLNGLICCWH